MSRSALFVSVAIHGSVLALIGWSSLFFAPPPAAPLGELSVALLTENSGPVADETPPGSAISTPTPPLAAPVLTPPAPVIEPPPAAVTPLELPPPVISTIADTPRKVSVPAPRKNERTPRPSRSSSLSSGVPGLASASATGGGSGGGGGEGYLPPRFLLRYKPAYPEEARAQRLEGVVLLLVSVDTEGRVTNASLRRSCGHGVLDRAALESVHTWRFTPARQADRVVPANVEIPIRFTFSA